MNQIMTKLEEKLEYDYLLQIRSMDRPIILVWLQGLMIQKIQKIQ